MQISGSFFTTPFLLNNGTFEVAPLEQFQSPITVTNNTQFSYQLVQGSSGQDQSLRCFISDEHLDEIFFWSSSNRYFFSLNKFGPTRFHVVENNNQIELQGFTYRLFEGEYLFNVKNVSNSKVSFSVQTIE